MKKKLKRISSIVVTLIVFFTCFLGSTFADENARVLSNEYDIILTDEEKQMMSTDVDFDFEKKERFGPHKFSINISTNYDEIVVKAGNLGVDSIDSVSGTVKIGATTKKFSMGSVLPGSETKTISFPMMKASESISVTITAREGGQSFTKTSNVKRVVPSSLMSRWHRGSFSTQALSLENHFRKHRAEVGAKNIVNYLNKAIEFSKNLRGATVSNVSGHVAGVKRYKKAGKYIDLAPNKMIISYGKQ